MQQADKGHSATLEGEGLRIGIVRARFNDAITSAIAAACMAELGRLDVADDDIRHVSVPGALEIPVALKAMAEAGEYDALVATESGAGVTRVALDHLLPVANAILTCDSEDQAWERAGDKGVDAARAAVEMANLLDDLS